MVVNSNLKYLLILIIIFIILCSGYIIINPIFMGPDALGHFAYVYYIAVNNKLPDFIGNWKIKEYVDENFSVERDKNYVFLIDGDYAIVKGCTGVGPYQNMAHNPPLYYLFSSLLIKQFGNLGGLKKITADTESSWVINEDLENSQQIDRRIIYNKNNILSPIIFLRFIQLFYGILIILILYKILSIIFEDRFKEYTVLLISSICFLPKFIFICSYINNDALAILLGLTSVYFLILLIKRERSYYGYISILFAIAAVLTKYHTLTILVITFIYFIIWLIRKRRIKELMIFVGVIVIFSTVTVIYLINVKQDGKIIEHFDRAFLARLIKVFKGIKNLFSKKYFLEFIPKLIKTSIAAFGINHIIADNFIYYFYYSYIIGGLALFLKNMKKLKKDSNIIFVIGVTIFLVFMASSLYNAGVGSFAQWGGRIVMIAVIFTLLLSLIGYENLGNNFKKVLYPFLFGYFIFINFVCLYAYVYLPFYKNYMVNFVVF